MKKIAGWCYIAMVLGSAVPGFGATNYVVNLGKVNDSLYRGAQPDLLAMKQLRLMGVKSIINLRMTNDVWEAETTLAAGYSMAYTNIPLNSLTAPTDAQVTQVLAAIDKLPKPVFVHCQYGCDRTGTIIACYRIQKDLWSNTMALREAELYGISPLEVEKRLYILRFKRHAVP